MTVKWYSCNVCGVSSKTNECLLTHKKLDLCQQFHTCPACNQIMKRINKATHFCGHAFCNICKSLYPKERKYGKQTTETHQCFVQRPSAMRKRKETTTTTLVEGSSLSTNNQPDSSKRPRYSTDQEVSMELTTMDNDDDDRPHEEEEISTYTKTAPMDIVVDDTPTKTDEKIFVFDIETDQSSDTHKPVMLIVESISTSNTTTATVFKGYNCIDDFCTAIFKDDEQKHVKQTYFAHFGSGFDFLPILEWLHTEARFLPQVIMQGTRILSMRVGEKKFLDSFLFIPIPLANFSSTFNIDEHKKGYFPHYLSTPQNQNYVGAPGQFPHKDLFGAGSFTVGKKSDAFNLWHAEQCAVYYQSGKQYNFAKELEEYCRSDVKVLKHGILKFRQLIEKLTNGVIKDVFSVGITAASACNYIFREMFMPTQSIAILPIGPGGTVSYLPRDNQSVSALVWLRWLERTNGIRLHRSGGALGCGEKKIGPYKVDGYYEQQQQHQTDNAARSPPDAERVPGAPRRDVFEFFGCYFHGCPTCYPDQTMYNKKTKCSMGELHGQVLQRLDYFEKQGIEVTYVWECQFKITMSENKDLKLMFDEYQSPLNPRDAFFGGRTENFKTWWVGKQQHGEEHFEEHLKYVDICSLYPYVNANCVYPVGHPDNILTKTQGHFRPFYDYKADSNMPGNYNRICEKYFGVVKCRVLPPTSLLLPVLPMKKNGKLCFSLCNECVDSMEQNSLVECKHSDAKRSFWGTFCTPELNMAVKKGYFITDVSEVWNWNSSKQSKSIFDKYIKTFLKTKTEASGWPDSCVEKDSQDKFVQDFLAKEDVKLDPGNMKRNDGLRFISKLLLNSFWGYLGMRDNLPKTKYVNSYAEIVKHFSSKDLCVLDISIVGEDLAVMQYTDESAFIEPSPKTNVILAAFTTSHARTVLYSYMDGIDDPQRICYCDTDSVMYYQSNSKQNTIPTGNYLGDMTDELPKGVVVKEYYCAGPKFYLLSGIDKTKQSDDNIFNLYKVKGLTINQGTSLTVNPEKIKQLVLNEVEVLRSPFKFISRDRKTGKLSNKNCDKASRQTSNKRIFSSTTGCSIPYGYRLSAAV